MKYKREKSRRTAFLSLSFCLCLSVSMSRLIHIYVLVKLYFLTIENMYLYFFTIQNMYLHAYKMGGGGDGIGGETTMI